MIPSRLQHGRYELLGRLGRGGTAEVHRVLDTKTGHELAAKLVEGDHQARAVREGAILDALDHPNIVRVHARFDEGRWRVLLMELCAGSLADEVVEHGALDEPRLIEMGLAALSALSLAHARGVVHRDIKPQNLLLDQQGMLKVADFGVAAWRDATTELTRTGAVIGSVPFMAPEQRRGEPAGPAADLYALAATLAWCATGEVVGDLYTESVAARLRQTTRPTFADVLLRAGAHAPEDRFPSAQAMAEALRRVESETPRSSAAGTRGLPVRALLPVGGLLGVLVLTGIMSMGWAPERTISSAECPSEAVTTR